MKLYGFWRSLATYRVRIALRLKGIGFEEIPIDLLAGDQFKSDYDAINPEHVVPTLIDGDRRLFQSMAILEWLEERHPEPPLLPPDPDERAYARAVALVTIADTHPLTVPRVRKHLAEALSLDTEGVEAWGAHFIREGLKTYEKLFERRPPAPYALGSQVTVADIAVAGHAAGAGYFKVDVQDFPRFATLLDTVMALPEFAESHPLRQPGAPKASHG
ncbi:MAG TPA: maleylacetoacetate isomerase [Afifellaceae bacterium]|nr:maleylacetoacetate isomerase [Afifellaceae bacterium]